MTFSPEWETLYAGGAHFIEWPWSNVITWVTRFQNTKSEETRVIELGCGTGTNAPFFFAKSMDYAAIDGSGSAIHAARERFPDRRDRFAVADFTKEIPYPGTFDLIVERAAVSHNPTEDIRRCLGLAFERLKPGGHYIGLDWFSTAHSEYNGGQQLGDAYTRTAYDGDSFAFANCGTVHFSDEDHLTDLFSAFEIVFLQHNARTHMIPDRGYNLATWDIVAKRP